MKAFTSNTNSTSKMVRRMISRPKRCVPISKAVGGGWRVRLSAMAPMAVLVPVLTTRIRALPLITVVPMNTALVASCNSVTSAARAPGCFSTGYDSPVSKACLTNKSCASNTKPSAGTISPAESTARSPGTTSVTGTLIDSPSRITLACNETDLRKLSAALPARCS